jgi:hypothetical protein
MNRNTPERRARALVGVGAVAALVAGLGAGPASGPAAAASVSPVAGSTFGCPIPEALISDWLSGPDPIGKGEVLRVTSATQAV